MQYRMMMLTVVLVLAVLEVNGRPQLKLTRREYRAFKTVLGSSRPVSIASAIPVASFSDKSPSKFVRIPLSQLGYRKASGDLSPAEVVHIDAPKVSFGSAFGRGSVSGPIVHSSGSSDVVVNTGRHNQKINPPSSLTYGFRPIYDSRGNVEIGFDSDKVHADREVFSPSPKFSTGGGSFKPVTGHKVRGQTGGSYVEDTITEHLDLDLDLDLGQLGKTPGIDSIDFGIFDKLNTKGKGSDENLYRHHVPKSLIPTSGAGPGSNAIGKLLKSKNDAIDDSGLVIRSVDGPAQSNVVSKEITARSSVISAVPETDNKLKKRQDTSVNVERSLPSSEKNINTTPLNSNSNPFRLSGISSLGLFSNSGAVAVRGNNRNADVKPQNPGGSLFSTNAVRIPKLPNVQLPLQNQKGVLFRSVEDSNGKKNKVLVQMKDLPIQIQQFLKSKSQRSTSKTPNASSVKQQQQQQPLKQTSNSNSQKKIIHQNNFQQKNAATSRTEQVLRSLQGRPSASTLREPKQFGQTSSSQSSPQIFNSGFRPSRIQTSPNINTRNTISNTRFVPNPPNVAQHQIRNHQISPQFVNTNSVISRNNVAGISSNNAQPQKRQPLIQPQIVNSRPTSKTNTKTIFMTAAQFRQLQQQPNFRTTVLGHQTASKPKKTSGTMILSSSPPSSSQNVRLQIPNTQRTVSGIQTASKPSKTSGARIVSSSSPFSTQNVRLQIPNTQRTVSGIQTASKSSKTSGARIVSSSSPFSPQNVRLQIPSSQKTTSGIQAASKPSKISGARIVSSSSPFSSLPAAALQALGGAFGGGAPGGGQPHIIVKTLELDAKDADPGSAAFKAALARATKEARLELGVSSSEELGVAGADLAQLLGKRRRKRQLFGGEATSSAQTVGNALSTGAGLFDDIGNDGDDEILSDD